MNGKFPFCSCLLAMAMGTIFCSANAQETVPDDKCLECHSDNTLTKTDAAGKTISLFVDAARLRTSAHRTNTCASCHADLTSNHPDDEFPAEPVDCKCCHEQQSESYGASIHGIELKQGNVNAPTCADCHEHHQVLPHNSPASPLYFSNLARTCGECHEQEAADVEASVHGRAGRICGT